MKKTDKASSRKRHKSNIKEWLIPSAFIFFSLFFTELNRGYLLNYGPTHTYRGILQEKRIRHAGRRRFDDYEGTFRGIHGGSDRVIGFSQVEYEKISVGDTLDFLVSDIDTSAIRLLSSRLPLFFRKHYLRKQQELQEERTQNK